MSEVGRAGGLRLLMDEILSMGGTLRFKARGQSMHPFIRDGDTIIVGPVHEDAIEPGMVIVYRAANGIPLAHRVVQVTKEKPDRDTLLLVRGDGPSCVEEVVWASKTLGRVMAFERNGKVRRLDKGRLRLASTLAARSRWWVLLLVAPLMFTRTLASYTLMWFQQFRFFRLFASRIIGKGIVCRRATAQETSTLARVQRRGRGWDKPPWSTEDASAQDGLRGSSDAFVAERHGNIVGSLVMQRHVVDSVSTGGWWLLHVSVRVPFRGAGIGRRLVELALEKAASDGADSFNVLVEERGHLSGSFWRTLGFRLHPVRALHATYGNATSCIALSKQVPPRMDAGAHYEVVNAQTCSQKPLGGTVHGGGGQPRPTAIFSVKVPPSRYPRGDRY